MKQIIRDSSGYYLLGYNSSQAPTDGKFHNIKVNVKRKGLEVRARKGYWAYTADDVARVQFGAETTEAPTRSRPRSTTSRADARQVGPFLDRDRARGERHDPT